MDSKYLITLCPLHHFLDHLSPSSITECYSHPYPIIQLPELYKLGFRLLSEILLVTLPISITPSRSLILLRFSTFFTMSVSVLRVMPD